MPSASPVPKPSCGDNRIPGFDAAGRCLWGNTAAEDLCGQSAATLRGQPYWELVAPADRPRLARQFLRQRRRGIGTSYARVGILHSSGAGQEVALRLYRVVT